MTFEKILIFSFILIFTILIFLFIVEYFVPISAKIEMNFACRAAALKVEQQGELDDATKSSLEFNLQKAGFSELSIQADGGGSQGSSIYFEVAAKFRYSKLTGLFRRSEIVEDMGYKRTIIIRKVVN